MYHTIVIPIIDYRSEIWGYKHYSEGDTINFRAIMYFLGVHFKAPLLALEGDMGCISCQIRHHINMIRLWNKFINMEERRITKCVFNLDYQVCKKIICNIDAAKCICVNLRNADWKTSLPSKPKLHTYACQM